LNTKVNIPDALLEALMIETGEKDKNRLIIIALERMLQTIELKKLLEKYNSLEIERADRVKQPTGEYERLKAAIGSGKPLEWSTEMRDWMIEMLEKISSGMFPDRAEIEEAEGEPVTWEHMYGIGKGIWNIDAQDYVDRSREERI
jgi:hypothetical protein